MVLDRALHADVLNDAPEVRRFLEEILPEQGALGVYGALHAAAVPVDLSISREEAMNAIGAAIVVVAAHGGEGAAALTGLPDAAAVLAEVRDLPRVQGIAAEVLGRLTQPNCDLPGPGDAAMGDGGLAATNGMMQQAIAALRVRLAATAKTAIGTSAGGAGA